MGVVNVTPDSFSDGGRFFETGVAIEHGLALAAAGAAMLDVGGESTRPGAGPVDTSEELRRVVPVVRALVAATTVPVSIDTTKAEVAAAALDAGAVVVNDISAGLADDRMLAVIAERGAGFVAMHMQGTPRTMQSHPEYVDVVGEVGAISARASAPRSRPASRLTRSSSTPVSGSARPSITTWRCCARCPSWRSPVARRSSSVPRASRSSARCSAGCRWTSATKRRWPRRSGASSRESRWCASTTSSRRCARPR